MGVKVKLDLPLWPCVILVRTGIKNPSEYITSSALVNSIGSGTKSSTVGSDDLT